MKFATDTVRGLISIYSGRRGKALFAISGGWFLYIGLQMMYPVLLPDLRASYGLSLSLAGLLVTVLWLALAAGQLPAGVLSDYLGGVRVLISSLVVAAFAVALVATSTSLILLYSATALFGAGLALYSVARFTLLRQIYPEKLGTSTGLILAAGDAGQTILPPLATVIAVWLSWRYSFGVAVPLFLLIAFLFWVTVPQDEPGKDGDLGLPSRENLQYLRRHLWQPAIVLGTLSLISYGVVWAAFTAFYPTYLIDIKGMSGTISSILFGLFFGLGIFLKPLSGIVYDQSSIRRALLLSVITPSIAFTILPVAEEFWLLLIVTILAAPLLGIGAIVQPYILELLPDDIEGTGLAVVRAVFLTLTALSPVAFGAVGDLGYFDELYPPLALITVANVLIAFKLPPKAQ